MYANCPGREKVWSITSTPNSTTRKILSGTTARRSVIIHRVSSDIYRLSIDMAELLEGDQPERPSPASRALMIASARPAVCSLV